MPRGRGGRGRGRAIGNGWGRAGGTRRSRDAQEGEEIVFPDIVHKQSVIGKQVGIPGSAWSGQMSLEEKRTIYKCTVREHSLLHKWTNSLDPPSEAWEVQEMGERGTGSLELGDSSGDIFWVKHSDFLRYYYATYPAESTTANNEGEVVELDGEEGGEEGGGEQQEGAASEALVVTTKEDKSALVYKYWHLESDTLIQLGRDAGLYSAKYTCAVVDSHGEACGAVRTIKHKLGKYGINSNLHAHISTMAKDQNCPHHAAALAELDDVNLKKTKDDDGNVVVKMNFAEAFPHHVHAVMMRAAGVASGRLFKKEEFQEYVRGFDKRAVFPDNQLMHRIAR